MKKQIVSNLTSNYALSLFGMGMGFLLVPFLVHKLGKEVFGLTVLVESTVAFFDILTISVRMALSRHATYSLSQGKTQDFIEYLSTGRVILFVSGTIVLAAGCILSLHFPSLFKVPAGFEGQSRLLFLFVTLGAAVSIPNIVFWSALYAKQRFDLINFSSSFGLVLRAACLFLFYSLMPKEKASIVAYGFIYFAMMAMQNTVVFFLAHKIYPDLAIRFRHFRLERVREIISFSAHTALTALSVLLFESASNILINVLWGPAFNAIYSVSLKFPNMMRRIFVEPAWTLTPTFTDLAARNDKPRIEALLIMYSKGLSIVTFPIIFALIFLSHILIRAWVGPSFALAGNLMPLFALPLFIIIPFALMGSLTNAYAKVKIPSFVSFCSAVANVAMGWIFGQVFSMRLYGIALAALLSTMGLSSAFFPYYACRVAGISLKRFWVESFFKPLALCVVAAGTGLVCWRGTGLPVQWGIPIFLFMTAFITMDYAASYFLVLDEIEKKHLKDIALSITGILRRPVVKTAPVETL